MSSPTSTIPGLEQIARKINARLRTITAGEGYLITCAPIVRPRRRADYSPTHGMTVLRLDSFEEGEPETAAAGVKMFRTAIWTIDHYIEPADDDDRPLDLLQAVAIAEIERALAEDFYLDASDTFAGAGGFAGLGHSAELRLPQILVDPDGATAGVRVSLAVGYAATDLDPYTLLP